MTKVSGSPGRASKATEPVRYPASWKVSPNSSKVAGRTGRQAYFVAPDGLPRTAPGNNAMGALRRDLPDQVQATVRYSDSCLVRCPGNSEMEVDLHRYGYQSQQWCSFTLQFSGFGVERGVLGEVVSLVGDCRPPPPGNPHRPITPVYCKAGLGGQRVRTARAVMGGFCFTAGNSKSGELLPSGWMQHSFNNNQKPHNLKELTIPQYFKNNRSYSSCMGRKHVLEFLHFHCHLCGQLVVEPPPIAITNVLETR
jgi:hypothetical protein